MTSSTMALSTTDSSYAPTSTVNNYSSSDKTSTTSSPHQVPIALTTPYVFPDPSCLDIWATTFGTTTAYSAHGLISTLIPIVYSNIFDPRFTSCQPSGWSTMLPESRFTFSPAVCPRDWTAYNTDVVSYTSQFSISRVVSRTATRAYCCAR
jgi:hypothetical protein